MSSFLEQAKRAFPAEIHMISCQQQQQEQQQQEDDIVFANMGGPYELPIPHHYHGMCTTAMIHALGGTTTTMTEDQKQQHNVTTKNNPQEPITWIDLLNRMKVYLQEQQQQKMKKGVMMCVLPQLTSTRPLQVQQPFAIIPNNNNNMGSHSEKRAVLIGIQYTGQSNGIPNSHQDVMNMSNYLINILGFQEHNVVRLMDDGRHLEPSHQNILQNLKQLCNRSKAGDVAFIHYSGHGGRWRDKDDNVKTTTEAAGYNGDETLIPVDVRTAGHIHESELYQNLLCIMPAGVHTTIVMDSRHSVMHLPYLQVDDINDNNNTRSTIQMSEVGGYAFHGLIGLATVGTIAVAVGAGAVTMNALENNNNIGGDDCCGCCGEIFGSMFGE